jgi:hypothetical protein
VSLAFTEALQEAADGSDQYLDEPWGSWQQQAGELLALHADAQLCAPGHELLELLCQLMDDDDDVGHEQGSSSSSNSSSNSSSSSSSRGGVSSSVAADDAADTSSSSSQAEALRQLVEQWQPSLELCRQLQQQQQQQDQLQQQQQQQQQQHKSQVGSSICGEGRDSAQLLQRLCAQACTQVVEVMLSDVRTGVTTDQQQLQQPEHHAASSHHHAVLAAGLLSSAADAQQLFRQQWQQELQQREQLQLPVQIQTNVQATEQQLPADALAQQLRVLGGTLVLRFVAAARAAGGVAWRQEVPLQAVLLLGAVEQLEGLALAAVRQQHLQQGLQQAQKQAAAAAGDEKHAGQQQQGHDSPCHGLLLMVQKLLDIIHLTRQFAELNAALNSSSCSSSNAGSSDSKVGSSSSSVHPVSLEELFSPGGPVHSLYAEPATLGGWTRAAHTAAASTGCSSSSSSSSSSSGRNTSLESSSGSDTGHQQRAGHERTEHMQQMPAAVQSSRQSSSCSKCSQQQLLSTAISGALLLFNAQQQAQRIAFEQLRNGKHSGTLLDWSQQAELLSILQDIQHKATQVGIAAPDEGVLRLLHAGSARLAQYRSAYEQQIEKLGIDPCWVTPQDAMDEADNSSSSSSRGNASNCSSSKGRGKSRAGDGIDAGQQQHKKQQATELVAAIKAAGRSIK